MHERFVGEYTPVVFPGSHLCNSCYQTSLITKTPVSLLDTYRTTRDTASCSSRIFPEDFPWVPCTSPPSLVTLQGSTLLSQSHSNNPPSTPAPLQPQTMTHTLDPRTLHPLPTHDTPRHNPRTNPDSLSVKNSPQNQPSPNRPTFSRA